jgi:hypothetical protein
LKHSVAAGALGLCSNTLSHKGNKLTIHKFKYCHQHEETIHTIILFQINDLQKLIQIKKIQINDLLHKERELTEKFQAATNDSKFAGFLRKMYNKKYKLQKAGSPGGESLKYK